MGLPGPLESSSPDAFGAMFMKDFTVAFVRTHMRTKVARAYLQAGCHSCFIVRIL